MTIILPYTQLRRHVLHVFEHAPDRNWETRQNPFTGGNFVPSMGDDISEQVEIAVTALRASIWFQAQSPLFVEVPVPCTRQDVSRMKANGSFGYLAGCYWQSLQAGGLDIEVHPSYQDYACGVMALDPLPEPLRGDAFLDMAYRPQKLNGLKLNNLVWHPAT